MLEQRWESVPATEFQKMPFLAREPSFQMKIILILAGTHGTHTLTTRRTQNESLFGANISPEA